MEQIKAWEYRYRFPSSEVESLREWSWSRMVDGEVATLPLTDPGGPVEVEWRPLHELGDTPHEWQAAVPHEFGTATADFAVSVLSAQDFREENIVRAIGIVRGHPVCFELAMPKEAIAPFTHLIVPGSSFAPGAGIILREAGEFSSANADFKIANVEPSKGALLPLDGPAVPGALPFRGAFFARAGKLSASEIELLIEQCHSKS